MKLFDAPRFGTGVGLARVGFIFEQLEVDRRWLSEASVAITGSNGKGSTAAMCAAIAEAHGLSTGLFTSPHLYRMEERIRVRGEEVSPTQLENAARRVGQIARAYVARHPDQAFGAFELLFGAAVDIFARERSALCVLEAGIGGRYDPTRLAMSPVAAVTSVELEHTTILGPTRELIALDKTDICAKDGAVFYGVGCEDLEGNVRAYCRLQELGPAFLNRDRAFGDVLASAACTSFTVELSNGVSHRFETPLLGAHQASNAALAILVFEEWCRRTGRAFSPELAAIGLSRVRWPGRLETICDDPTVIIDVGHTPDAVALAVQGMRARVGKRPVVLVVGVSTDKAADAMLARLAPLFTHVVCTSAHHKGRPADVIATIARSHHPSAKVLVAERVEDAVPLSIRLAAELDAAVYVAGGMYVAVEFAEAFRGGDPQTLPHL